jgi:hypothetical protein
MDGTHCRIVEMVKAYLSVKDAGLKNVKSSNCHVFARMKSEWNILKAMVGLEALG